MSGIKHLALGLALAGGLGNAQAYVNIVFDYSFDTAGFFTADRRATLEQAATAFESRIFDDLTAITSTPGGNGYIIEVNQPNDSGVKTRFENASVKAGELRIYVGSGNTGNQNKEGLPIMATQGGYGGVTSTTNIMSEYAQNTRNRGQEGWPDSEPAMWGGTIEFSNQASWYADTDVSTVESFAGKYDLYTAALKGLITVLGANGDTNDAWYAQLNGLGKFNGAHAKEQYGVRNSRGILQAIPMEELISANTRLAANIKGKLANGAEQTALFSYGLATGERRFLTELDYAVLDDMGWDVTGFTEMPTTPPVPEPQTWLMFAAGLGFVGYRLRASSKV